MGERADATVYEHSLEGCRLPAMASYLKALAIMKLVHEQADPRVRGAWRGDVFVLRTHMDQVALLDFFTGHYSPTPIVGPWNGGSGFYASDNQEAITAIRESQDPRFGEYRDVIEGIFEWDEIPAPHETVGALQRAIERAVEEGSQTGTAKDRRDARDTLDKAASVAAKVSGVLDGRELAEVKLAALEDALKGSGDREADGLVKAWWKELKKLRTLAARFSRGGNKDEIQKVARARLTERSIQWLDAAFALRGDGSADYNPVLGTGGNEGKLDFTNNFMQRLLEVVGPKADVPRSRQMLAASLFGTPLGELPKTKLGQFDPGKAGGINQSNGFEFKDTRANPWDYVLTLEGATVLGAAVHKRLTDGGPGAMAAPFTVRFSAAGFGSSAEVEAGRAESWMPVWRRPAGFRELQQLFREGRATVGKREARTGLDFTRAVRTLGVSRGVDEFVRYAFLVRRGQSYVALPAGRMRVRFDARVRLLDDLDPIMDQVRRYISGLGNTPPASLNRGRKRVEDAMFAVATRPEPERFGALVEALGDLDKLLATRAASASKAPPKPLAGLRPSWVSACDDGSVEVRLAAALASVRGDRSRRVGPLRSNFAGVDPKKPWAWASGHGQRRWLGSNLVERLGGAVAQRLMDADRLGASETPLDGALRLSVYDLVPFLYGGDETGDLDLGRVEALMWGFGLVRWASDDHRDGLQEVRRAWRNPLARLPVPRSYALLKTALWPGPVRGVEIRRETRIVGLLQAERVEDALEVAHRRLRTAGLRPLPVRAAGDVAAAHLLAALAVPLRGAEVLGDMVLEPQPGAERATG